MRILLTADPELPVPPLLYGGVERVIDMLIKELLADGHEVTLCANPNSKVHCELVIWKGAHSRNKADILKNIATLTRLVWTREFDVIHSFSRLAYMTALFPSPVPKIMSYQREPTLRQIGKAVTLSKRGSLLFTGCSDYITHQIATVAEAYTVYNCAPFEHYSASAVIEDDAPLVFLGRLEEIKGTHIAIQVAQRSNRRLVIAGNIASEWQSYFDERVKPHLTDRIRYIGPVDDGQKRELLRKAHAFLMPILWNEPFGIVMAEAMACGAPVLGFPRGSVPEVVQHGVTGYICNNVDEMVANVLKCPELNRLSIRSEAEKKFSTRAVANEYVKLYWMLADRRK